MANISLAELKQGRSNVPATQGEIGFTSIEGFMALQRMAAMFTASSMVPNTFQGQANLGNSAIALDMAIRMKANPLMVMQSLYIVHGRPSWSAQFLIATLNKSGKFSALRYEFQGKEGSDDWGCRACATELATKETLKGPLITIALAKKEGWYGKSGSKWQTMPELMLRYRAASWFVRAYAPEIAMGLPETEELYDTVDVTPAEPVTVQAEEAKPELTVEEIAKKARRKVAKPQTEVVVEQEEAPAAQPEPQAAEAEEQPQEDAVVESAEAPQAADDAAEEMTAPFDCPKEEGFHPLASYCAECPDVNGCPAWG